jgi:branched-chain amino acid transport system permease protein
MGPRPGEIGPGPANPRPPHARTPGTAAGGGGARRVQLAQAVISGIQIGLIYALVAVGLTIIWGLMGMINFAHGELMMWGMFAAWSLAHFFRLDPIVTLVPIGLAAYAVGTAIYRLLMARVQRGEIFTQIFATFGLLLFMQNLANAAFTSDYHFLTNTFLTTLLGGSLRAGPFVFGVPQLAGGAIALLCFLGLYLLIERTETGLALQATAEDAEAAALMGIKAGRMYAMAWGVGAALAAVSGVIVANFFAIFPQVGLQFTLLAYATVALGGFGSIPGTLLAALVVGVIETVTALWLPPAFKDAFVFGSYLFLGLFRPQGLFGHF